MKTRFRSSFAKDLRNITDRKILRRIEEVIDAIERAQTFQDVANLQKLQGGKEYYRIRVGDYRLGLVIEEDRVTFVRCLTRKEIYRYFP